MRTGANLAQTYRRSDGAAAVSGADQGAVDGVAAAGEGARAAAHRQGAGDAGFRG